MKKYLLIFTTILMSFTCFSQAGIGTSNPNSNSILELQATNRALLLPRVANTAAIASPVNGMVIYDISSNCIRSFENNAWSGCWSTDSTNTTATVTVDCGNSGFQGTMLSGIAIANGFYKVTIKNNTFASVTIPLAASDLVLSGNTAGAPAVTVGIISTTAGGASITSIAIPALATQTLFYKINGTPTTSGTLNAVWTKQVLTCQSSTVIGAPLATLNCAGAVHNGTLFNATLASGVSSDIPYTGGDGNAHPGQVVTSTGVTGLTATLAPGNFAVGNGNLNYVITGTPSTTGVATFAISIGGRTCSLTRTVISASTNGTGIVSAYVCNTASAGTLAVGTAATGVTQTITATVTTIGTYNISTTTANGVTFSGSGTFAGTGARTIVLTATGTPTDPGTGSFTINTTPSCTFTRVINPAATFACNSSVITTNNWEL
ncbi:MAG: hypothetical protein ACOVOV_19000, partial [Dolichospermum sp.]